MADSYFSNVVLLAQFDEGNGSTTFTESSTSPKALTAVGNAAVSTTSPKIGSGALSLDGARDCVTTPGVADFVFGTGDFCVDLWVKTTDTNCLLVDFFPDGPWQMMLDASGRLQWYGVLTGAVSVNTGVWVHVAASRNSGTLRLFVDGVADGSADYSTNLSGTNAYLALGAQKTNYNSVYDFSGEMDAVRVTKGVARYTTGFTPPSLSSDYAPPGFATFAGTAPVPSPRLTAQGHNSTGEQAAYLTAPTPTLAITTGANAKALRAPSPTLTASGTVTIMATATLTAPKPTLSATGTVSGMATATLSAPRPNLVGYGGAVCSVTVRGKASLTATGTTGGVASVAVTCPLFELTSTASIGNVATANLIAPSPELGRTIQAWLTAPSARLTAIGSAVVTATYEAYAVNLGHRPRVTNQEIPIDEVTHYTNFPFTHVVRYKNSYYGANSTGLYLLEGTTDDGTAIPWAVKTAMDDFKTPVKKTVAAAYFSGRFGPASTVQLHAGEDTPNTYSFTTPRDALAQNHRQVFGKGVKERYFALGASGTGTVELDTIELETHNMTRRI